MFSLTKTLILPACIGTLLALLIINAMYLTTSEPKITHNDTPSPPINNTIEKPSQTQKPQQKSTEFYVTSSNHNISQAPFSYADAVSKATPAVVNIYSSKVITTAPHPLFNDPIFRRYFRFRDIPLQQRLHSSLGSGVIVDTEGFLLTNHHVVAGADEILVALQDGRESKASIIGSDPETDLAVLKIQLPNIPVLQWSSSDLLRVGDIVLAIGNPFGVGQTVTKGIVSGKNRSGLQLSTFENFIQTDAAINPGNSGGALINAFGDLIGINTAIFSRSGGSQGIGFAVPSKIARKVLFDIVENGRVIRGWLGAYTQPLTELQRTNLGLEKTNGIVITGVVEQGPANQAGLQVGDIILQINDNSIQGEQQTRTFIANLLPGDRVKLLVLRQQNQKILELTIGQRPTKVYQ